MDHSGGLLRRLSTAVNASEKELCSLPFPHPIFGVAPITKDDKLSGKDENMPTASWDLHPFLASMDTDNGAAVLLHAAELKTGTAKVLTNAVFTETFFSARDAVNRMNEDKALVWMTYAR